MYKDSIANIVLTAIKLTSQVSNYFLSSDEAIGKLFRSRE